MQKTNLILALILTFAFALPQSASASLKERVTSDEYSVRAPARLAQGLSNFGLGWTALFIQPVKSLKTKGDHLGNGLIRGIAYPVANAVMGSWDIATFWVPGPETLGRDMAVTENPFTQ